LDGGAAMSGRWALAIMVLLLTINALFSGESIDFSVVNNPRQVTINDRAASLRWQSLFDPTPPNATRTIALLGAAMPQRIATLLAARMMYRGQPWTRREDDAVQISAKDWRRRCRPVLATALRELRLCQTPGLVDIYRAYITFEDDPELSISALVNLMGMDAKAARFDALRLADATRSDALPAAADPAMRRRACAFLVDGWGIDDEAARLAVIFALRRGDGDERNAAIGLLDPGQAGDLVVATLIDLLGKRHRQQLAAVDMLSFELLTAHLTQITDPRLATDMVEVVVTGDRPMALAAATVLARGVPIATTMPWDAIAARIQAVRTSDPALRDGLAALLMRLRPVAVPAAPQGEDPWRRLAEHRERLARWEWEGLAR